MESIAASPARLAPPTWDEVVDLDDGESTGPDAEDEVRRLETSVITRDISPAITKRCFFSSPASPCLARQLFLWLLAVFFASLRACATSSGLRPSRKRIAIVRAMTRVALSRSRPRLTPRPLLSSRVKTDAAQDDTRRHANGGRSGDAVEGVNQAGKRGGVEEDGKDTAAVGKTSYEKGDEEEEEDETEDESDAPRWATPSARTAAAVGAAFAAAAAEPPVFKVWIQDMRFHPADVEIPAGSYVQW